jgi:hypothetical protein
MKNKQCLLVCKETAKTLLTWKISKYGNRTRPVWFQQNWKKKLKKSQWSKPNLDITCLRFYFLRIAEEKSDGFLPLNVTVMIYEGDIKMSLYHAHYMVRNLFCSPSYTSVTQDLSLVSQKEKCSKYWWLSMKWDIT